MAKVSYSIVEYYAEHEGYKCGYCKSPNTNFSHGMWAHSLTVEDYQSLIDRGWRRSGSYCYKPTLEQTCCPLYTIKCEALDFRISKSQKKVLKRMVKFLKNELVNDNIKDMNEDQHDNIDINNEEALNYAKHHAKAQKNLSKINVSSMDSEISGRMSIDPIETSKDTSISKISISASSSDQRQLTNAEKKSASHSSNENISTVPRKKAKLLRIERKQNKLLAQGKSQSEIESIMREKKQQNCAKSLEELFDEVYTGLKKFEIKLVRVMSDEFLTTLDASASVYKKYQMAIHGDSPEECDRKSFFNFLVKSPLQVYFVYLISNDVKRHLCESAFLSRSHSEPQCSYSQPWISESGTPGIPPQGYGSFHEQYWLNNELIAVGVIDILPSCVSSVYFFYDPAYSQLSLGTFSSLREIYLTRQLNKVAPVLRYYYMGFYIHTCPKMRYKARMRPSKLLCPETYTWFDIDPCLVKLDNEKYSRLNDDIDAIDEDGVVDTREVLVLHNQIAMQYRIYKARLAHQITRKEEREVKEYATLVGMPCARRMLLYRS
ncbi:arginyl-tRNA--protein transferase 1 isoform X1 [Odontomachus brunneus]|uniref:arginyl-tRNA--protein transferase 1 isoform X1 n=1 Tax=Odontomachus brunneus TaxID=486640 RepID=UPI0013F262AE|nr:arginyl-tRNA--protein transferase 1 isoform X1 [Odontomachus brunneus]XP_032691598.1 arginyl-tRNA--protein transferase 1 isoform X1 [Odontomachus brunneus]XP_032691677.1 arginyl-tRNA--protein transferase 1 isoform X1 [Odontomachus brunneus]